MSNKEAQFQKLCQLCSPNFSKNEILASDIDWPVVWRLALRHRVVPVIADRIDKLRISVPDDIAALMANNVRNNLYKGMKQAAELVRLTLLFKENNIPFVAFKGIALLKLVGSELHQRHHGDMDILLADVEDIHTADLILREVGYQRLTLPQSLFLNKYQEKHFKKYEKDVVYYNPEKSIQLELHFKLCLSDKLLPISSSTFYDRHETVSINSVEIPVMSKADHQVYLLVHGAVSRWFRLKWLCDIPLVSENGSKYQSTNFSVRVKRLHIERIVIIGLRLSSDLLSMPIPSSPQQLVYKSGKIEFITQIIHKNIADDSISGMSLGEKVKFWFVFSLLYMPLIKDCYAYKLDHFRSYITRVSDWELMPLPSYLFFLYYPLRPLLWLRRQMIR